MADDLEDRISDAAAKPASASVDGQTVTEQSLPDLIAADRYLSAKAAARKRHRGLRFTRLLQPGTVPSAEE